MAAQSALHTRALERLSHGEPETAIELLREAITEDLDPELVNDLAVVLADTGAGEEARTLLRGLLVLSPDCAPAQTNLRALGPDAGADPQPGLPEARAAFLQLVAEASARVLPDNLDPLFHPFGHELPAADEVGVRLSEQLAVLERAGVLWERFGDEASRELWLRFLAYRALGPAHVRLQLDPGEYRRIVVGLSAHTMRTPAAVPTHGMPFEWGLHHYDLNPLGIPVQVVGPPLPLASTYCFSQYAYREAGAGAAPRTGDVVVDAGGCWGDTALWLAYTVGHTGTVHTFEPSPRNRQLLQRNLALNPALAGRVRVHDAPLAATAGEEVWIDDVIAAGATVRDHAAAREGVTAVPLRTDTIDALVDRGAIERLDFLKVDVEGADLGVLRGAAATIAAQRPRLAIAAYHRPDDLVAIPDYIASLGVEYRWYLQCSTMTDVDTVAFGVPA
jgi:FkbM family methyltransferase